MEWPWKRKDEVLKLIVSRGWVRPITWLGWLRLSPLRSSNTRWCKVKDGSWPSTDGDMTMVLCLLHTLLTTTTTITIIQPKLPSSTAVFLWFYILSFFFVLSYLETLKDFTQLWPVGGCDLILLQYFCILYFEFCDMYLVFCVSAFENIETLASWWLRPYPSTLLDTRPVSLLPPSNQHLALSIFAKPAASQHKRETTQDNKRKITTIKVKQNSESWNRHKNLIL